MMTMVFTVKKKKCTAMFTTMLLSVTAEIEMKKGEEAPEVFDICTDLQL